MTACGENSSSAGIRGCVLYFGIMEANVLSCDSTHRLRYGSNATDIDPLKLCILSSAELRVSILARGSLENLLSSVCSKSIVSCKQLSSKFTSILALLSVLRMLVSKIPL